MICCHKQQLVETLSKTSLRLKCEEKKYQFLVSLSISCGKYNCEIISKRIAKFRKTTDSVATMFFGIKVSEHLLLRILRSPLVFLFENNRHKHLTPVGSHQYCLLMLWKNFSREGSLTNTLAGTISYNRLPFPDTNLFTSAL